mmetsp:Transcript_57456/g.130189  ORF Transcript_57456/g.130189 Transcript_57456/m.130189 type:complete len:276 (-) Transcript_57456:127-954(-)
MLMGMLLPEVPAVAMGEVTTGGQRFSGHAEDPRVAALLAENTWDAVVLQDNSAVPGGSNERALAESRGALAEFFAPRLVGAAAPSSPDGKAASPLVLVYGTWGHRNGCVFEEHREAYLDYRTMQRRTSAGCRAYAELLSGLPSFDGRVRFVPAGDAFLRVLELCEANGEAAAADGQSQLQDQTADDESLFSRLYAPDTFHPSRLGTYLAACVFFAAVTGKTPVGLPWRPPPSCAHDEEMLRADGSWQPREMSEGDVCTLQAAAEWASREAGLLLL